MSLLNLLGPLVGCENTGYALPCRTVGGVSPYGVFLSPWVCPNDIGGGYLGMSQSQLSYVFNSDNSIQSFKVNGFGITPSTVGQKTFQQYCQESQVGSLIMTPDASNVTANGTFYSQNAVEFTMFGMSQELINEVNIIGNGRWQGIVIGNDRNFYFMGLYQPASITTAVGGINKMMGDLNGMTLTLQSNEQYGLTLITGTAGNNPASTKEQIYASAAYAVSGLLNYQNSN